MMADRCQSGPNLEFERSLTGRSCIIARYRPFEEAAMRLISDVTVDIVVARKLAIIKTIAHGHFPL